MLRNGLSAAGLLLIVLVAASCGASTSTTTSQPKPTSTSSSTASLDAYRAVVAADWPAIDSAYTAAACAKLDSHGMPADAAACKTDTLTLKAAAKKLVMDLAGKTPSAALASADANLKATLDDLIARLDESNLAIDNGNAPAFADAGGAIAAAYHAAAVAKAAILK